MSNDLTKIGFSPALKELMKKVGVNVDDPDLPKRVEQYRNDQYKSWLKQMKDDRQRYYQVKSLWSGSEARSFRFEDWKPDLQADSKKAREVGLQAWERANELKAGKAFNLLLMGAPGTGKTSLALAIAHRVEESGKSVMLLSTNQLRQAYAGEYYNDVNVKWEIDGSISAGIKVDLLIMDDLGVESGSDERVSPARKDLASTIHSIADKRFGGDDNQPFKPTIITTNFSLKDLEVMYGSRTISRLAPSSREHFLIFDGLEDVRGRGKQ